MLTTETRTAAATIDRKALSATLKSLAKVTEKRCTIPVARCTLIEVNAAGRVTLTATDTDMTMARDVAAQDTAAGQMMAETHALAAAVAKMPGDAVRITATPTGIILSTPTGADAVAVTSGKAQPADWPTLRAAAADAFTMDAAAVRDDFTRVAPAISPDPTRYYLGGIFLHLTGGALVSVATNGSILVKATRPAPVELDDTDGGALAKGVLIPRKGVETICAAIGAKPSGIVGLAVDDQRFTFTAPGVVIIGKTIEGTFPHYDRVIPPVAATGFTVDAGALAAAVGRMMLGVKRGNDLPLHFNATADGLTLASAANGAALIETAQAHGGGGCLGLNGRYITDMAATVFAGGDMVVMHNGKESDPALIRSDSHPDLIGVIMPYKVPNIAPLSPAAVRAMYGMAEPERAPTAPIADAAAIDTPAAVIEPVAAPEPVSCTDPAPVTETPATIGHVERLGAARLMAAAALEAAGVGADPMATDAIWRRFMACTLGISDPAAWDIETGRRQADRKRRNRGVTLIAHSFYEAMRDDFHSLAPLQPCPAPEPAQPAPPVTDADPVTLAALLKRIEALEARQHSPALPSGRAPRAAAHVAAIRAAVRARAQRDAARQDAAQARTNEAATRDQLRTACDRHSEALANAETLRGMLTVAEAECERLRTEQRDMRNALAEADKRAAADQAQLARLAPVAAALAAFAPAAL